MSKYFDQDIIAKNTVSKGVTIASTTYSTMPAIRIFCWPLVSCSHKRAYVNLK